MLGLAKKLFGTENDRKLKKLRPLVTKINGLEDSFVALTDDQLKLKTEEFKSRYKAGETLDDLLPEAFATVRETAKRTLGQRHYDVQLIGGITLHRGEIAEMRDAEWMGQVFNFLGLTVDCINNYEAYMPERKGAYDCDITYGTNNEFGFDYLRDNMKYTIEEMSQREHAYAIIDEIDSILIDEARTHPA